MLFRSPYRIFFDSPGGDLVAGMQLGRMIRARDLATGVGASTLYDRTAFGSEYTDPKRGTCVGACLFALLGGKERFFAGFERKESTGKVGVRQIAGAPGLSMNRLVAALIGYVAEMGADPRIVGIAASAPPGGVRYFSRAEFGDLKISWDPWQFGPWALEPAGDRVVARSSTPGRQETATFLCGEDRIPRLVMVAPHLEPEHYLRESIAVLQARGTEVEALGSSWPGSAFSARTIDGKLALELTLAGFDLDRLRVAKDIEVHNPFAHDVGFSYQLSTQRASETFRVVLRSCA